MHSGIVERFRGGDLAPVYRRSRGRRGATVITDRVVRYRAGLALLLAGAVVACAPRQENVRFTSGSVSLAGTLVSPRGRGPFPAIVFIHGSGPDSRENYRGQAVWFARQGFAALIYDKRGVGVSTGDWR
jgi:hypothetical protein